MSFFLAAEEKSHWECEGDHKLVNFFLGVEYLAHLADDVFGLDGSKVQFRDGAFRYDKGGAQLGAMIEQRMLISETISSIELDAWALMIGMHSLRHYSSIAKEPTQNACVALPARVLHAAIDFLRCRVASNVRLAEMAESVGMSQYAFARAFHASTGTTPHQFLTNMRVELARELLDDGKLPISNIAESVGFANQRHLTVQFRKALGITPARYRRSRRT
jgi:AraC family transcriptional regulator